MTEEPREAAEGGAAEEEPLELDTNTSDELDEVMREALEAVESSGDRATAVATRELAEAEEAAEAASEEHDYRALAAEYRERSLRTLADFENFRKRVQRERQDAAKFRTFEAMRDFLAVVDNLERALAAPGDVEDLKQGVGMILKQMEGLLRENAVVRVESEGKPFDPSVHDAVSRHETPEVSEPTVSEELQAGYTMHERLIRPARVKVAMPAGGRRSEEA